MVNIAQFEESLSNEIIPTDLPPHLGALWYDAKGDWQKAHGLIDKLSDRQSAHVHAYLHRKEGDLWNADYWYRSAGKTRPDVSLQQEWKQLLTLFLG